MRRATSRPRIRIAYRKPITQDGARIWALVRDSGKLDLNSPYCYAMLCEWFADTCVVAERASDGELVGMATGFRQPSAPDTLFVWQIAVADRHRGCGIASALLNKMAGRGNVRYVEATIAPSNASSHRLFRKWADSRGASISVSEGFVSADFPEGKHEREERYRIGPLCPET